MEGSGQVPETHKGSVQWGEGLCSGMGSGLEKASAPQGQQCPQAWLTEPGPRSPAPTACLCHSFWSLYQDTLSQ